MPIKDKDKAAAYKKEYNKKWYEQNKVKRIAQIKERKQQNREREIGYSRKNYELHHDKILERKKEYRERNKDKLATKLKEYRSRPQFKEARRASDKKYTMRKKAAVTSRQVVGSDEQVPASPSSAASGPSSQQEVATSLFALQEGISMKAVRDSYSVVFLV